MNSLVALFFVHTTLATVVLGYKFFSRGDNASKNFGLGLILNGLAFASWSIAVLTNIINLDTMVTIGSGFLAASFIFFLASGMQNLSASKRKTVITVGSLAAIAIFFIRTFIFSSQPGFTAEGLFFFNPHPIVQALYILGFLVATMPAIHLVSSGLLHKFSSNLVRYGFTTLVATGIVLITSTDQTLLYINGWAIGITYIVLWTTLLFGGEKMWTKKA